MGCPQPPPWRNTQEEWQSTGEIRHVHQLTLASCYRASEGKTVEVPYRGDVNATILDVLGGIRSACTYTGAGKLKEMPKRTTFIRVSQQLNEIFSGGN